MSSGAVQQAQASSTAACNPRPAVPVDRPARPVDELPAINQVIEDAVMGWRLADQVKRLALPSYRYDTADFADLDVRVARAGNGRVVGVATSAPAAAGDCPPGTRGLLLHGLFVAPPVQRRGIGAALLARVLADAGAAGYDGVLVKAQRDAAPFFIAQGFAALPVGDPQRHYAHRLWRRVD